jgi:hypothetical protein
MRNLKIAGLVLFVALNPLIASFSAAADDAVATPLMQKELPDILGKEVTLTPGQTFYEGPDDIHTVGRNASSTKPAKFLVFLLKNRGAPALIPAK